MNHERGKCCVCEKPADAKISEELFCARHAKEKQLSSLRPGTLDRRRHLGDTSQRRPGMQQRQVLANIS